MGGFNNATPGQSGRRNVVRYDTPTFAGFSASASWGADDMWDTALTYKGDVGDFALVGKVGYGESTDPTVNSGQCALGTGDCQWWGAAGTIMHTPTGLYVYAGYGATQIDLTAAQVGDDDESTTWFVQGGIEKRFFPSARRPCLASSARMTWVCPRPRRDPNSTSGQLVSCRTSKMLRWIST